MAGTAQQGGHDKIQFTVFLPGVETTPELHNIVHDGRTSLVFLFLPEETHHIRVRFLDPPSSDIANLILVTEFREAQQHHLTKAV